MMRRRVVAWTWIAGALLSSGCGAARPIKYYQLTVPGDMTQATDANALPVTLLIGPLSGSHLYREDHIIYSTPGEHMGMYDSQRWAAPPTEMMQEVLFRQLRASGRYQTVNTLRSNARGDFILQGRLYDFKEVSTNPLVARVAVEYVGVNVGGTGRLSIRRRGLGSSVPSRISAWTFTLISPTASHPSAPAWPSSL